MSEIQVVKRRAVSYTATGAAATREESYIKILTSFRNGTLRHLQGAPLSCFLDVALHEADDPPGVTLEVIAAETGISYRHLLRVMPQLCAERYCEIAEVAPAGNQIYRVAAYAWFGSNNHRSVPPPRGSNTQEHVQRAPASNARKQNKGSCDILSHDIGVPHDDDVLDVNNGQNIHEKTSSSMEEIERVLSHAFEGVNVKRLAARIESVAAAQAWVAWCQSAETRKRYRNPPGAAYTLLMQTPNAPPPRVRAAPETTKRKSRIIGLLAEPKDQTI